jgi:hypothetical protein
MTNEVRIVSHFMQQQKPTTKEDCERILVAEKKLLPRLEEHQHS